MMAGQVTRNRILPVIDSLIHTTPSFILNSAPYLNHRDHKKFLQDKWLATFAEKACRLSACIIDLFQLSARCCGCPGSAGIFRREFFEKMSSRRWSRAVCFSAESSANSLISPRGDTEWKAITYHRKPFLPVASAWGYRGVDFSPLVSTVCIINRLEQLQCMKNTKSK